MRYESGINTHYSSTGFTLIELMVILSITAILGMVGIAGFNNYNKVQTLQNATNDLVTTLNTAKSRVASQIKVGINCSLQTNTLDSYEVQISIVAKSYNLIIHCNNGVSNFSNIIYTKLLPADISFKPAPDTSPASYIFPVLKGGVTAGGQIVLIDSDNRQRTITVTSLGGINQ